MKGEKRNTYFTSSESMNGSTVPTTHDPLNLLAPGNPIPINASISLNNADEQAIAEGRSVFVKIKCYVSFIDAFGNAWQQTFDRTLEYLRGVATVFIQTNRLEPTKILNQDKK